MAAENYYEILGLKQGVSDEEVKQAFRDHAKVLHPDRNPDDPDAERRFKLVNTAYEALKDAARRRAYDEWLAFARRHERSRLAQWGRLAALITVLLLGPSIALYQAFILLENWDKPRRPVAAVNATDQPKSSALSERLGGTPARQPAAPQPAPQAAAPQPSEPVRTAPESKPPATARPDVTAALPRREEPSPAPRPEPAPAARSIESTQPKSETPPASPVPVPRTAEPARPASPPDAAPDSRTPRRPLREVVGADDETPPPQTPRPLSPSREPPAERSAVPAPAEPATVPQEGAARGMARILAELKEPGGALGPPLPVPPDNQSTGRESNQTRLAPDEESSQQRGGSGSEAEDFSDCPRCPVMSVVKPTDLVPRAERGPSGRSLAISKFEVTVAEWNACAQEGACQGMRSHPGGANRPVVDVSRAEAAAYAEWLSRKTGRPYRLMKVGGWAPPERGEETRSGRAAPRSAQECGGPDWSWLDDEECLRRFRQSERAARGSGQQPNQSSSGFRVARSLGPDG